MFIKKKDITEARKRVKRYQEFKKLTMDLVQAYVDMIRTEGFSPFSSLNPLLNLIIIYKYLALRSIINNMRIWDIPLDRLCRNHLLGEHNELHAI